MGAQTPIEWTDATWNPIGGCSIKSPGCRPCYAQLLAGTRLATHPLYAGTTTKAANGKHVFNGKLTIAPDDSPVWRWPIGWRGAKNPKLGPGQPSLIFVGDMSDLFHEDRPFAHIDKVVDTILASRHIGQLLTKRTDVMLHYFRTRPAERAEQVRKLWLGFSAERQREFDERWPAMRELAAMGFTIFVSYEPAIGPLVLPADFLALGDRAQVIAGGMSGTDDDITPSRPDWFRSVRDQCKPAGVAFHFKQWGRWSPERPTSGPWKDFTPSAEILALGPPMWPVGKDKAGRLLDGVEHNGFPRVEARP